MTRLLHLSASPRGEQSESLALGKSFLTGYRQTHLDAVIDEWDLWDTPLPYLGATAARAKMNALAGFELSDEEQATRLDVRATFDRFNSYDHYLFTVPMWNHGFPYVLKHFIDVVSQNDMLFSITPEDGYRGLLTDKKAAVVYTAAVYHPDSPDKFGVDHQAAYFDYWLNFAGITDTARITFLANLFDPNAAETRTRAHESATALGKGF
ncbi:flavodoxin family protein [Nocardia panacis]|uniref:FMN dependent NADH:quinone oxidoreductase n=1 Tax=Nocardia panacis TaxID=2340916 RepID=A0A3A4K7Z2_9NOCA|nr:NAD(P)H-dependent oxidoreductase [Nocardia panacis]RJO75154.1 flavodoxin family protein [Nocardia panacis]